MIGIAQFFILIQAMFKAFDAMCRKIVCPTRHSDINERDMIQRRFRRQQVYFQQWHVTNGEGQKLSVIVFPRDFNHLPTVLYLHGNGGHKMECLQLVNHQINLIAFDFAACGKSEGNFVTYGQKEGRDIDCVLTEVRRRYGARKIGLWGRSMGASLAVMYASLHPRQISWLILDTPFRSLRQVVRNVAEHNTRAVPGFILSLLLYIVQSKLEEMVGVDVFAADFLMYLNLLIDIPIYFIYSNQDIVVRQQNVRQLYDSYKGCKQLRAIEALHHQDRPRQMIQDAIAFILTEQGSRSTRSSMTSNGRRGISMSIRGHQQFSP